MNKRFTAIALSAALTLSVPAAAFAEDGIMLISGNDTEITATRQTSDTQMLSGKITAVSENSIELKLADQDYILNIGEETVVSDKDGIPINLSELKEGDFITAFASTAETLSLPPQAAAFAVIRHGENEDFPIYMEISEIETDDYGTFGYSKDGQYEISISEKSEYKPFRTRQIVKAEDITKGSKVLVFAKSMTMSIPALMNPDKIVLIGTAAEEDTEQKTSYTVSSEDKSFEAEPHSENGIDYLPVRAVAEALGYDVDWSDSLKAVTVGTVQMGATFNVGVNKYTKAKMKAAELSAAPILVGDKMYVPTDFFTEILELKVNK